ncbi:MAG TPA: glycosyltransferase family 4 protein [Solirubrobacteraceae bacterium]|nr:glycosyltransferase family 4 protein [Solirubrobacteraceae bacterium]
MLSARAAGAAAAGARPRLLLITPDYPPAHGGIQTTAHRVATGVTAMDTRVVALASAGAGAFDRGALSRGEAVAVRRAPSDPRLRGARNVALNAVAMMDALRFRPDVILSLHLVASPAAAAIRRALGARTVQYFHAKEIPAKARLAAFAAAQADVVVAVGAYTEGLIRATGAPVAEMRRVSPGVDLPADPRPLPAERPTFVTVARLEDRYKGHDVLMRALALVRERVPDVQWAVIGEGPLRAELEELARAQGVAGSVRFLGALSDAQRDTWLRRARLLAMPSRLPAGARAGEGFGIVYTEAAAYGKPVVAGNVGGALDAVLDGQTGLLVDPADPRAVGEAIATLLLDFDLAQRLGRAGAQRAQEFAWPLVVGRLQEVLLEQADRARSARG